MNKFESFLAQQLKRYLIYRKNLGYAYKNSVVNLKIFDQYLKKRKIKNEILTPSFFLNMRTDLKMEAGTVNVIISNIRTFFQYLMRIGIYKENPLQDIPKLQENQFIPYIFSPEETDRLLLAVCRRFRKNPEHFLLDYSRYMALLLLSRCGMRISEPLKLQFKHYRIEEGTLYIEKTKFKKDRLIPMPASTAIEMKNYLQTRKSIAVVDHNPYLLSGIKNRKLSHTSFRLVFDKAVKDIGIDHSRQIVGSTTFGPPTPHCLRHSFAINTLKNIRQRGKSAQHALPVLATYMGHKKFEHTVEYLKMIDAKQRPRLLDFVKKQRGKT